MTSPDILGGNFTELAEGIHQNGKPEHGYVPHGQAHDSRTYTDKPHPSEKPHFTVITSMSASTPPMMGRLLRESWEPFLCFLPSNRKGDRKSAIKHPSGLNNIDLTRSERAWTAPTSVVDLLRCTPLLVAPGTRVCPQ